jgi:ribose transport system ATP-binding protein
MELTDVDRVEFLVEMRGITKTFPGVVALDDVTFRCKAGEVHAVVGENGAGKSTLMKLLAGVYEPDRGQIILNSQTVHMASPHEAQELGVSIIYQELNLLPDMSVAENVFLGRESVRRFGLLNEDEQVEKARDVLHRLGVDTDPRTQLGRLTVPQQQMVEIAKALSLNAQVVIMDEPSAALGIRDLEYVFDVIRALKQQGVAVIYISHRIAEIFEIADRVTVFKDGQVVGTRPVAEIDRPELVRMMVGQSFSETFPPKGKTSGEDVLRMEGVEIEGRLNIDELAVRAGEIVGISGLVGAGRTQLAQVIFGTKRIDRGTIRINGEQVDLRNPRIALRHGIGYLTEDRNTEGLVLGQTVIQNVALPSLDTRQRWRIIDRRTEEQTVAAITADVQLKAPSLKVDVENLSGGNRQKVVLAKWLISGPELLIFDEPTRGIDVGAKSEIWGLMRELADQGKALLMISSELPEIVGMSDRVYVMHRGRLVGEISGEETTEENVMMLATYGEQHGD